MKQWRFLTEDEFEQALPRLAYNLGWNDGHPIEIRLTRKHFVIEVAPDGCMTRDPL